MRQVQRINIVKKRILKYSIEKKNRLMIYAPFDRPILDDEHYYRHEFSQKIYNETYLPY